uniref:hypothetical protein n=1 Tax=Cephaleuros parasiticus TaxID=173370 RepID=UPI001EE051AF|nr:hypothetical protein MFQ79_pgp006 [Cephaleuros parasiticus]UIB39056.1 hypothetical protein [Cephaleuros parasiticus]
MGLAPAKPFYLLFFSYLSPKRGTQARTPVINDRGTSGKDVILFPSFFFFLGSITNDLQIVKQFEGRRPSRKGKKNSGEKEKPKKDSLALLKNNLLSFFNIIINFILFVNSK